MSETQVKLSARELDAEIGIRSRDADELFNVHGKKRMAIIELESFRFTDELDKADVVTCRVTKLELVPVDHEEYSRELQAAFYRQRQPAPLDPELNQETSDDVVNRGKARILEPADA